MGQENTEYAEELLKEIEKHKIKYRIVADHTADWEFWLSPEGALLYCSPSCEKITGYPDSSFYKNPDFFLSLIHPEDLPCFLDHRHDGPNAGGLEFRIIRKDGEIRRLEHYCQAVYDSDGTYLGHRGNNRDVTKRRLAEEEAVKAKREWESTFDSITDPIMLLDTSQRITRANKALSERLGLPLERIVGLNCYKLIHGTQAPPDFCPYTKQIEDGEVHTVEVYLEALRGWYLITVSPLVGLDGGLYGCVHNTRDITELKQTEEKLRRERNRAQKYLDVAGVMLVALDPSGRVKLINKRGCEVLGYPEEEILDRDWFGIFIPERISEEVRAVFLRLISGDVKAAEYSENAVLTRGGQEKIIAFHNTVLENGNGKVAGILFSGEDVTDRKNYEARLIKLAHHDQLTGLPNRNLLVDRLALAMAHATRYGKTLGVLYMDLDNFKDINDMFGHETGDLLLKSFAGRLTACMRGEDTVARLGGDEFIAVIVECTGAESVAAAGNRILDAMAVPFQMKGVEVRATASIGIALYPEDGGNVDALLKKADAAMYRAKKCGGNAYKFYREDQDGCGLRERKSA